MIQAHRIIKDTELLGKHAGIFGAAAKLIKTVATIWLVHNHSRVKCAYGHGKLIMLNLIWLRKITVNKEFLRPGRIMRDRVAFISL